MTDQYIEPPEHLQAAGRRYWREVMAEWELEPERLAILENACGCLDRIAQCRNRVRRDGLTVASSRDGRPVAHPLLSAERQAQSLHAQLVKALGLNDEPAPSERFGRANKGGRPPSSTTYTPRAKRADG